MITLTIKDIIQAKGALTSLAQQKMAIKDSYTVSKMIRKANKELEDFNEERQRIIANRTDDDQKSLQDELVEAMEVEVELPVNKLDANRLDVQLTPQEVAVLGPFIDFHDEDDEVPEEIEAPALVQVNKK